MGVLKGYIYTIVYISIILLVAFILQKKKIVSNEGTRKIVHIGVGFSWFIINYYLHGSIHSVVLPSFFCFVNAGLKLSKIKLMKRETNDSWGTVFYPLSMGILALITYLNNDYLIPYIIGFFSMVFADGLAPLIGKKIPIKKLKEYKSIGSFLSVIIITLIIIVITNYIMEVNINTFIIITLSILSGIIEHFGSKGIDNLTLPLGLSLLSYLYMIIR